MKYRKGTKQKKKRIRKKEENKQRIKKFWKILAKKRKVRKLKNIQTLK